ncbi:molybdopterin synthase catalytic subunit MoaE [Exilibacterium tricleocarpae]|uniref:Molybdopterin synthase catalytic subunit n=1 Tax=Exilibacterium tricleocarpae TaxID=2591008 RepID=A0A545U846_9GAMM|nr:molybdopterin synthase catalytic subunit MoaE [Exilibacterium tricleocarpae]TQV85636.1 molybdopterin synthase catalytic subunit MoaE [Exilibacterium tricleocarpae]
MTAATPAKAVDRIRVQTDDFDLQAEYQTLRGIDAAAGAVVLFTGLVRDLNQGDAVRGLTLEHYPGMTEKVLADIVTEARQRWRLLQVSILHRVGALAPADQIVLVGCASAHRGDAFAACEFIMDFLKTRAPFWKQERTAGGHRWVEARDTDRDAAKRW